MSEHTTTPDTPLSVSNQANVMESHDLTTLISRSFMQLWDAGPLYIADPISKTVPLCDHAVIMKNQIILFSFQDICIEHVPNQTKKRIIKQRRNRIYQAHHQLTDAINALQKPSVTIYTDANGERELELPENYTAYLVCLTDIHITSGEKRIPFNHQYGSNYLIEECVLDFDDANQTTQLFSFSDFVTIVDTLENMPDLANFLSCHRTHVVLGSAFENELFVLEDFIETGEVLVKAHEIETDLVAGGMRQGLDPKLAVSDTIEQTDQFLTMRQNAKFWDEMVKMYAAQVPANDLKQASKYRDLLCAIMSESIYSRNNLVKVIVDFRNTPPEQREEGYIVHMRSYSDELRHYVMLFYSTNENHPNHRNNSKHRLANVASGINFHLQNPTMNEIIVIGFGDNQDNFSVDMYYMKGVPLSEAQRQELLEQQKAQQLAQQQLKGSQPTDFSNIPKKSTTQVSEVTEKNPASAAYDALSANSSKHPIDRPRKGFKKRLVVNKAAPKIQQHTSSRNALCPCGSGKKFRHCHGAPVVDYSA